MDNILYISVESLNVQFLTCSMSAPHTTFATAVTGTNQSSLVLNERDFFKKGIIYLIPFFKKSVLSLKA